MLRTFVWSHDICIGIYVYVYFFDIVVYGSFWMLFLYSCIWIYVLRYKCVFFCIFVIFKCITVIHVLMRAGVCLAAHGTEEGLIPLLHLCTFLHNFVTSE